MSNLIVLAGVPGSGKSTWAKRLFDLKASIVSPDTIRLKEYGSLEAAWTPENAATHGERVWKQSHRLTEEYLSHNVDVVFDATNLCQNGRKDLIQIGWDCNASCHLILFKNVLEAAVRNAQRKGAARVPEDVMARMMGQYYDTLAQVIQESWDSVLKVESYR
jgi:predicted kinase